MNTKRTLFGILACLVFTLSAVSCTSTTADDDQLFEQGIEKKDVVRPGDRR